jgi:hypothetical protein
MTNPQVMFEQSYLLNTTVVASIGLKTNTYVVQECRIWDSNHT